MGKKVETLLFNAVLLHAVRIGSASLMHCLRVVYMPFVCVNVFVVRAKFLLSFKLHTFSATYLCIFFNRHGSHGKYEFIYGLNESTASQVFFVHIYFCGRMIRYVVKLNLISYRMRCRNTCIAMAQLPPQCIQTCIQKQCEEKHVYYGNCFWMPARVWFHIILLLFFFVPFDGLLSNLRCEQEMWHMIWQENLFTHAFV